MDQGSVREETPFLGPQVPLHTQMQQRTVLPPGISPLPVTKPRNIMLYPHQLYRPEIVNKTSLQIQQQVPKHFPSDSHAADQNLPREAGLTMAAIHPSLLKTHFRPSMDLKTWTTSLRLVPGDIPDQSARRSLQKSQEEEMMTMMMGKSLETDINRLKKSLNVDSPSFTPSTLAVPSKTSSISSQAANAAPFTPRSLASGATTPAPQPEPQPAFNPAQIREFTPQNYELSDTVNVYMMFIMMHGLFLTMLLGLSHRWRFRWTVSL